MTAGQSETEIDQSADERFFMATLPLLGLALLLGVVGLTLASAGNSLGEPVTVSGVILFGIHVLVNKLASRRSAA